MRRANPIHGLALLAIIACSGGGAGPAEPVAPTEQPAADDEASARQAALAALEQRQEAACRRVAPAVTACAVEDARANLSPSELAELDLEKLVPVAEQKFVTACLDTEMSLRQVQVYEQCMEDTSCGVFVPCLDAAEPERGTDAP